jgi:hypothetical protein
MPSQEFHALLRERVRARSDVVCSTHPLAHRAGTWELLRIASTGLAPEEMRAEDRVVVVRATIHGDEVAGALTILNYFDALVDYAHERDLKLILYPLGNPSGFDRGLRYNADHHMGEGNNDFLRYLMADGSIEGDLGPGRPFESWRMADDPSLGIDLPAESRLMLELVRQDPLDQVVAAFDLHQDYVTDLPSCAYHYAFGDLGRYAPVVARVAEVVPLLAGFDMAGGFGEQIDADGTVLPHPEGQAMRSDDHGFIVRHDASFSDFFDRLGVGHSIATETSGATPMDQACLVNWIWLTGVMDLLSREGPG